MNIANVETITLKISSQGTWCGSIIPLMLTLEQIITDSRVKLIKIEKVTDCVYTRFLKLKIKLKTKKIKAEKILETFFSVFVSK